MTARSPRRWFAAIWIAGCVIQLAATQAGAQGTPPSSPASPGVGSTPNGGVPAAKPVSGPAAGPAAAEVREAKPEVYFVRDKDGNLVPVPDFSYEEFKRLYDLDQKLTQAAAPPAFVIQELHAEGTAGDDFADLEIRLKWVVKSDAWVKIPLRLGTAVLRETPAYDGPGEYFLEGERGGGFSAWIRERDSQPHALRLKVRVALKRQGDESQLALPAPVAAITELKMTVPRARVSASIMGGGSLVANEHPTPTTTLLQAAGLGENFTLSWRPQETGAGRMLSAVDATSNIEVRVEGMRRITSEARIRLRGLGVGLDTFRVRLPAGMEFVPALEPGYTVELLEPEAVGGAGAARGSSVVEVKLESRGAPAAEVRVRAVTSASGKPVADESFETLGFEVLGAVRQSGQVDVYVDGEWNVVFQERSHVQPAELTDAARQQGAVARFEFARQPCSLVVQVRPRKSRVQVEPTYLVSVGTTQARLQANLNYRVRGATTPKLQLDLAGWTVDRIEPERLAAEPVATDANGWLTIPAPSDVGMMGRDFEVQVFAHLDLSGDQPIALPIPRPLGEGAGAALVVVAPDDNVSLTPKPADMAGLVPEPLPPTLSLPARLQTPWYYRVRVDAEPKRFVAELRRRPRAMSVRMEHALRVTPDGVRADHRLRYVVAHEPVSRVHVRLGRDVAVRIPPQFYLDTGIGAWTPLAEQVIGPGEGATPSWVLTLPEPRQGDFTIVARLAWPLGDAPDGAPAEFEAPLVVPEASVETTIVRNELRLLADSPWRVELAPREWREEVRGADETGVQGETRFVAPDSADAATLRMGRGTAGQTPFWVQAAWVQTWLAGTTRHDRVAWRVVAHESPLVVLLPGGVERDEVTAAVDGAQTAADLGDDGTLRVPVRADGKEHIVELSCFRPRETRAGQVERFELPRLLHSNRPPRFLWQLVTPRDEHLVLLPRELIPELQWKWSGGVWERRGTWGQSQLERWAGATAQEDLPQETNQYLFSAVGGVEVVEIRLAPRVWLLSVASTAALVAGLALLYVRPLRHPFVLAVAGMGLLASSLALPEAAVALAQAALYGWALALLARLLKSSAAGRSSPVVVRSQSRSSLSRPASESLDVPLDLGPELPPATTETAAPTFPAPVAPKA